MEYRLKQRILFCERKNAVSILQLYDVLAAQDCEYDFKLMKFKCLASNSRIINYSMFAFLFFLDFFILLKAIVEYKPDILIVNFADPSYFYLRLAHHFKLLHRIKVVKINHELQNSLSKRLQKQNLWLSQYAMRNVFVSEASRRSFEKDGISVKSGVVIRNPVNVPVQNLNAKRQKLCVFAARLDSNKGAELAVDWFNSMRVFDKELSLLIIGDGAKRSELERKISRGSLDGKIKLIKPLDRLELLRIFQKSKFYFAASRYEAMNVTIAEALLCGCRVLASNIPAHVEYSQFVKSGIYFTPRKPKLDRSLIEQLLSDNDVVDIRRGVFDQAKCRDSYFEIFLSLSCD